MCDVLRAVPGRVQLGGLFRSQTATTMVAMHIEPRIHCRSQRTDAGAST